MENAETAYFVTLTYDDNEIPLGKFSDSVGHTYIAPYVSKTDVQKFFKRLRKKYEGSEIRYFLVSEYGPTTFRPHYHLILYNLPRFSQDTLLQDAKITKDLQKIWSLGFITLDKVTYGRISYVTKYMSCTTDLPEYLPPPFRLMSKGLGKSYLDKTDRIEWHRQNLACYYPDGKFKLRFPRYLKDKIFDDSMKMDIHDQIIQSRQEARLKDIENAENFGYKNYVEYRQSMIERHVRKFNNKCKKSRRDI